MPPDGPPQEGFAVLADGSGTVTRLIASQHDQPVAWLADGSLAVAGSQGVVVAADGSAVEQLGDGYLHSRCAWRDR
jgi:hypothetical protein